MSLSGNLDIFPLEEVLRLLSRSHQSGCLRVEGAGAGRVYLEGGSISYAAVEPDDSLRAVLIGSGLVTDESLAQLDLSNGTLSEALTPDASSSALSDVIREQCVESLYRIRKPGSGPFAFSVDSRPRYATGQSYDIEMLVSEADRRASEWADIEQVVPDLHSPWRMVPSIDEESVKLSDVAWRFLAALEGRSSVEDLATRLGLTSFQAGRRMAELARARLVEPAPVSEPTTVDARAPLYESPITPEPELTEPSWETPAPAFEVPTVAEAPAEDEGAPQERSWWEEPTSEQESIPKEPEAETVTSDEGFLEDVFGRLEETAAPDEDDEKSSNDDDDDEEGGGFGLLRRRGLGAAFRELADS